MLTSRAFMDPQSHEVKDKAIGAAEVKGKDLAMEAFQMEFQLLTIKIKLGGGKP